MKRIAGIASLASLALLAYSCAHLEVHFAPAHAPIALQDARDDGLVSNGIDGGRPPAEHVEE